MGLDWIPCRVEQHVDPEFAHEVVQREYERFVLRSGYVPWQLLPLLSRNPYADDNERDDVPDRICQLSEILLVKHWYSHRVYVISELEILPLQWRLEAHKTILPDELSDTFRRWQSYLMSVREGAYRGYLEEVLLYISTIEVGRVVTETLQVTERSLETSASWSKRPETCAVREKLLEFPAPPIPEIPQFDLKMSRTADIDGRHAWLRGYTSQFCELVDEWNAAARRGNWKFEKPPEIMSLEPWIAKWLAHEWFAEFAEWLSPWIEGGYGLYRDCE